MLQNTLGDVSELPCVQQLGDQEIAQGKDPFTYESYLELLFSVCSTCDKKISNSRKQKHAVHLTSRDDEHQQHDECSDMEYEAFKVDTDISDIMMYNSDTNRFDYNNNKESQANFLPCEEWDKLTQTQKDVLLKKRRKDLYGGYNNH
jgi:hypothetical protein